MGCATNKGHVNGICGKTLQMIAKKARAYLVQVLAHLG
jgi:hypothetical protein